MAEVVVFPVPEKVHVHRVRDRCVLPEDCRVGAVGFDTHRSLAAVGVKLSDRVREGKTVVIHHSDHG